ncbi:polyribonucleotide nucleotidyltransferase [Candidatus Roizmanbacteria bacterium]|nr:polyribonucleotide nucleotidyltransferase [Candidatus Roizmanbacteria bacterium]
MKHTSSIDIAGRTFTIEVGRLAQQADSAVLVSYGETVVLATVVSSKKESSLSYFPLTVEYAEKLYSGGRIKGSRWVKREGRPSDDVILTARLIDRSIRPLFPKSYHHEVQVIVTVLSIDKENNPDIVGLLAASYALSFSSVPWNGPIASARMGSVAGELVVNPTSAQIAQSDLDLIVSASDKKVIMLEAGAKEFPDDAMERAIQKAQTEITAIISHINEETRKVGKEKQKTPSVVESSFIAKLTKSDKTEIITLMTAAASKEKKAEEQLQDLKTKLIEKHTENYTEDDILTTMDSIFNNHVRHEILTKQKRIDGRGLTDIRPLTIEVGVLPRTHGSALFQRGETQALTITTLGSPSMEQWLESPEGEETKRYLHHYNMPPFSVGETGRVGWPSRREIGHGALAERALVPVLPSASEFPYTIQVVSEVLSSNGSTSMASTCGSTLSLMDAGVPIKELVAGISIGLVEEKDTYALLTDIMGVEDFNGDMDFKVAGTKNGITAIQLDVKSNGLTAAMIQKTLVQAKEARRIILERMMSIIPVPRPAVSPFAPKIETVQIPVEKIGEVIGPGGKIIRSIIAATGCDVNVEDDGVVTVAGTEKDKVQHAVSWIKNIVREVKAGEEFNGVVKRILPFGAFVEVLPGKEGLVHLSKMSTGFVKTPEDVVAIGQQVTVRVVEIDDQGRINLSMLSEQEDAAKRMNRTGESQRRPYNRPYRHPHLQRDQ